MQLPQLDSGSQAQHELLVLWPLSELVPLVLVEPAALVLAETALVQVVAALVAALVLVDPALAAALVQVGAVAAAAPVADRLGNEGRTAA